MINNGETMVGAFSFPITHGDLKNKRIRFVKYRQPCLTFFLFISPTFRRSFLKNGKKVKRCGLINSLKPVPSIYLKRIQSSALPKISLTRGSQRKHIFQEDKYAGFVDFDTISALNYVTKQDCTAGFIFKRK